MTEARLLIYADEFDYSEDASYLSEEWLWRKYWDEMMTLEEISAEYHISRFELASLMRQYEIPRRAVNSDFTKLSRSRKMTAHYQRGDIDFNKGYTSIEVALYEALSELDLPYEEQFSPDGYSKIYDAIIFPDILVEIHGDYWHSLPTALINDEEKLAWAHDNNYRLVVIWEHEISEFGIGQLIESRILPLMERTEENDYS